MRSDSSILSNIPTSGHAISGRATKTREEVDPSIIADLRTCEHCDVETLLNVLLKRCRDSPPPSKPTPLSDADQATPCLPSTDSSPNGSSSSTDTVRPCSGSTHSSSPNPNAEDNPTNPPAQLELLQNCLEAVLPLCEDEGLLERLKGFQFSGKEPKRCAPLVKLLNYALGLLAPLSLPEIRAASDLQMLFAVNHKRVHWRPGSARYPELVLLSLAAMRQVYNKSDSDRDSFAKECLSGKPVKNLEWPDVLASVKVKWTHDPIQSDLPEAYGTRLGDSIGQLSVDGNWVDLAGTISSDTTSTSTSAPVPSSDYISSSGSIPSSDSSRGFSNVGDPAANSDGSMLSKRSSDHLVPDSSEPKRQKQSHHDQRVTRMEAVIQSGGYGAEMLYCSPGRGHAFGLVNIDVTLWVWWYDRQGAIQSTGINFIRNLPHFLVLLFVLQRLNLADWGFNEALDPSITLRHGPQNSQSSGSTSEVPPASENGQVATRVQTTSAEFAINSSLKIRYNIPMQTPLYAPLCLKGRSTNGFGVTNALDAANTSIGSPTPFVAKLYWPHRDRLKEEDIIKQACGVADDLGNHLPFVVGSYDIDVTGTLRVRQELGIDSDSPCRPRALRIIIFERLIPITNLEGDDFVIALVECIRCHFVLWKHGLCHQDISLANLMTRFTKGHYHGVLNDWDLAFSEGQSKVEKDLTATVPYVAIHLLTQRVQGEKVKRLYYYELESFFWSMVWMFLATQDKSFQPGLKVAEWVTADFRKSTQVRGNFILFPNITPLEEWRTYWEMTKEAVEWVRSHYTPSQEETPDNNLELLRSFLVVVGRKLKAPMPIIPAVENL
ncbi:hypothetical protein ACGC1H_000169 [Rhizoctonia solani]|uniref:Fungal-type protein kinase domain-containing protein n=1 Tax=Rhizoctonia solani TaxID=456999 RepID=A0A8H2WNW3_9AGAM|nr:unnamed protein product [Rhizoctonia solani]